jgi:hypothetical protein
MEWWNIEFIFNLLQQRLCVFDHYSSIPIFHDLEVNIIRRQRKKKKGACLLSRKEGSFLILSGEVSDDISFFIF